VDLVVTGILSHLYKSEPEYEMTLEEFIEKYKREHPGARPIDILELADNAETPAAKAFYVKASDMMLSPLFKTGILQSTQGLNAQNSNETRNQSDEDGT
jgi:hypothetical protein